MNVAGRNPAGRAGGASALSRLEYEKRVNRVIDHIREHLADELSLEALAGVAAFSPFHFHRIFRVLTGETLFGFIQRLRLERAAVALVHHPAEKVLVVALDHGFASAAGFARAFKVHFGMSASAWRHGGAARWRKRRNEDRNLGKASRRRSGERRAMKVTVAALPPCRVAYMRHVGPYGAHGIPGLWARFIRWMEPRGLLGPESIRLGIGHDDPDVTPPEKCRYDACVVVPDSFEADRWVNVTTVPGGRYAVSRFTGTAHEVREAWEALYRRWLPASGYEPDDRPCLEVYRRRRQTSRPARNVPLRALRPHPRTVGGSR